MKKVPYGELASEKKKKQFGNYLNDDEEMIIFTGVSMIYLQQKFIMHWMIALMVLIPVCLGIFWFFQLNLLHALIIGVVLSLLYATQRFYFTKEGIQYILTNKRLIVQIGYFEVTLFSVNYDKISHIEVIQGFIDRLFYKYGTVLVRTAGMDKKSVKLDYVDEPFAFKNVLERLIHQERKSYGSGS